MLCWLLRFCFVIVLFRVCVTFAWVVALVLGLVFCDWVVILLRGWSFGFGFCVCGAGILLDVFVVGL